MKKFISVFLSIAIITSISCLSVFAHNVHGKYKTYTVIGDSIAAGYGLEKDANGDNIVSHWERVKDSYADIVTDELGCNLNIQARDGFTAASELVLIDPEYRNTLTDEGEHVVSSTFTQTGDLTDAELAEKQKVAAQEIKDSDLITVNLGSNDLFISTLFRMAYMNAVVKDYTPMLKEFTDMLSDYGTVGSTVAKFINVEGSLSTVNIAAISSFVSFIHNYELLMDKIHELNPNATVLALGLFNPIKGTNLAGLQINNAFLTSNLIKMANMYIKELCPAREYYTYVDIYDIDIYQLKISLTDSTLTNDPNYVADGTVWHPTRTGQAQIAEKILDTLDDLYESDPCSCYKDIDRSAWYHDAVDYSIDKGIMKGTSSTTFEPDTKLTRAQLVQMLYADAGKPSAKSSVNFTDVKSGLWYSDAVNWASSKGIVSGYSDGTFKPNSIVTREEMVVILNAYAKNKGVSVNRSTELSFKDASSVSEWAENAMSWAVASKLISGYEDNTVRPQGKTTRAEAAQIMKAFYSL